MATKKENDLVLKKATAKSKSVAKKVTSAKKVKKSTANVGKMADRVASKAFDKKLPFKRK